MPLPDGFVYLRDVAPGIHAEVAYYGSKNFLGRPVAGYDAPVLILTEPAAEAAAHVQAELAKKGLGLKVFDAYRPTRAVHDFIAWSHDGAPDDPAIKARYYPNIDKARLFEAGYLAEHSSHSRGSTMDLTVIDEGTGRELDFGTPFDFFDPMTHTDHAAISGAARANRDMLLEVMGAAGFVNYPYEWWHFTLDGEPHPETYFDFVVG